VNNELYDYSPITERPALPMPDGKKLAFYVGLNIEHFLVDHVAPGGITGGSAPDPMAYGVRDYGNRVGIWRMIDLFDEVGIRASVLANSDICTQYPQIVEAGIARNWAWLGHGQTNSIMQAGMDEDAERAFLADMMATFDATLPARPRGWLGPGLTETFNTPKILREYGFTYLLDWCCDDRPFELNIPGMLSVPYNLDINDIGVFTGKTVPGSVYEEMVMDQFEVLMSEGGRVMALPLHPFVTGQPYRFKYLSRVIKAITSHPDVWVTTSDDIADAYVASAQLAAAS
jgi:peptidoglycan/xylan/chitin deacetylase (PgdA/CDA1 family)